MRSCVKRKKVHEPNTELVEQMRRASDKLDLAIEAGERGDWPRAEVSVIEVQAELVRVLREIETVNDIDRMAGKR